MTLEPGPHLRSRVWVNDELIEETIVDYFASDVQTIAEGHAVRWLDELEAGHRCRVVVDDPDVPDGAPWFEAREDGVMLVFDRSIGRVAQ